MKLIVSAFVLFFAINLSAQNCLNTYSGNGLPNLTNGNVSLAQYRNPSGLCKDKFGNMFVADGDNNIIRKISAAGVVSTYAGSGIAGYRNGSKDSAQFDSPFDICADDLGNVYVTDFNNQRIRKISVIGIVSTVAGNGIAGFKEGASDSAEFNYPRGIVWTPSNHLFIGDSWNHRIRKINLSTNTVSTFAGGGSTMGVGSVGSWIDGPDTSARFYTPCGLSIDTAFNLYLADAYNHRIRKIDVNAVVTTIAGSGPTGTTVGDFIDGSVSIAQLNVPTELCWTASKGIFIGDTYNDALRLLDFDGFVSTMAGAGIPGYKDSCATTLALMNHPRGLVASPNADSIFIIDGNNHAIRLLYKEMLPSTIFNLRDNNLIYLTQDRNILFLHLPVSNQEIVKYNISNVLGQYNYLNKINSNRCENGIELNIESLQNGIYFMNLELEGQRKTIKFLR